MVIGPGNDGTVCKGQLRLTAAEDTPMAVAGDYYQVQGVFADGDIKNFSLAADGTLTYSGMSGNVFLLSGSSDLAGNKVCEVTYSVFVNGVLAPGAQTPHSFKNAAETQNISITGLLSLNNGDAITVRAKSDAANTTITVSTLTVTLWGER
jgi:hypothetical protein